MYILQKWLEIQYCTGTENKENCVHWSEKDERGGRERDRERERLGRNRDREGDTEKERKRDRE
jgi:hypothetical protein